MDKKLKDYFFLSSTGFRKMTRKKRGLDILQFFVDLYIGSECLLVLHSSYSALPFTLFLVLLAKIILHFFRRDSLGNYIGICFNTLLIVMSLSFKLGFLATPLVAYIVHFLRIKSCFIDRKLKDVYGYPNFNFMFMEIELSQDTLMTESVKADYDELLSDPIIRFSAAESRCSTKIQLLRIAGILVLCAGVIFLHLGVRDMSVYNNSMEVTSLDNCTIGTNITGTVYELYDNCVSGVSKNVNDGYWGIFGDELVMFDVPEGYKSSFAALYDSYADEYDLVRASIDDDRGDIFRKTGITFRGKLLAAEDCEFIVEAPDFRELGFDVPKASTSYFIRVIDGDSARSTYNKGIFLIFLGLAVASVAMVLIYRKIEDYTDFNDELF